jgi:hypothetical protein
MRNSRPGEEVSQGDESISTSSSVHSCARRGNALRRIDLRSVNWWDGMLVSQSHFLDQERCFEESLRWLRRYGLPLHGILPAPAGDAPAFELDARIESENRLRVELLHCHALTRDGSMIHVDADSVAQQTQPVVSQLEINPQPARTVPVYVRPSGRKHTAGERDRTGHPAHCYPEYELVLDDAQVAGDGSALKIAEIKVADYRAEVDAEFLPAAASLDALPALAGVRDAIIDEVHGALEACAKRLGETPPVPDADSLHLSRRGILTMMVTGCTTTLGTIMSAETQSPPVFLGQVRGLLLLFSQALACYPLARQVLDEEFLSSGGLPAHAGGVEFHAEISRFIAASYAHEALGQQLQRARQLLEEMGHCLRDIGSRLEAAPQVTPVQTSQQRVTYRERDYYQLEYGELESSFGEESQVLYFRDLRARNIRSVLFVLRNNLPEGATTRDIRLKGGINDDRPLFCPDLAPDFNARAGQIYMLMEVEPGKRDNVNYISLRSSGTIDLEALFARKDQDVRLFFI